MQGRPPKPLHLAIIDGAAEMSPARFKDRSDPTNNALLDPNNPPDYLDPLEAATWTELVRSIWWVCVSDAWMVELAARMMAVIRVERIEPKEAALLVNILTRLGGTPTSRNNVALPPGGDARKKARFA